MLLWRVQLCGLLPQPPAGLHRVVSLLALAVGRKASATHYSSQVLLVEVREASLDVLEVSDEIVALPRF